MSTSKKTVWENYRFSIILIISIAIGSIIGLIFGERAVVLKPFGDIFLNLMFTAVTPLVFITIASAVGSMVNMRRLGKILGNMLLVFVITGLIAAVLIIIIVKIYPPAEGVNIQVEAAGELEKLTFADQVVSAVTVNDFSKILSRSNMLPLIVFSILFGYCVSAVGGEDNIVAKALDALSKVMMKFISVIMLYAPIGLGAYFASLIGEFGPQLLGAYARAMVVYYPLCVVYFFIFFAGYTYYAGGMEAVKSFFKNIVEPSITSIATQ
ncbi:MAG: cation:dicarboxylase symporter family transporter, partial [Sedimentibacter sp.]